ncbi:uncharacterized protein LOC117315828 [Pecten maximus]|uniref:uncharacterized protein LOC117315828 n=1 Tax=Pecten maximus TaxID=6579 RepID=UPI001458657A|nr:uncharacterized protein LOC117315828 [Pecten maximus]
MANAQIQLQQRMPLELCFQQFLSSHVFFTIQCVWRKTQSCGLATRYSNDDDVKTLVRRPAVLPLVPVGRVEDVWFNALEDSEDHTPEMTRFKDYITETWVESHDKETWNHFENAGPRTKNHVEGWHSKVNRLCSSAHPNIYSIIKLIKSIQATNESKIIQLEAGARPRRKKAKYQRIDARLRILKDRFRNGELDVYAYADAASHLIYLNE